MRAAAGSAVPAARPIALFKPRIAITPS